MKHYTHNTVLQDDSSVGEPNEKDELRPAVALGDDHPIRGPKEEDELRPVYKQGNGASENPQWILAKSRQYFGVDASVVGWIARSTARTRSYLQQ